MAQNHAEIKQLSLSTCTVKVMAPAVFGLVEKLPCTSCHDHKCSRSLPEPGTTVRGRDGEKHGRACFVFLGSKVTSQEPTCSHQANGAAQHCAEDPQDLVTLQRRRSQVPHLWEAL